jgi:hypothetical protein
MKKLLVALAASLAVFFGMGGAAHAQYGGNSGVVIVTPPTVAPGGTVTVTVTNCTPGERVDITVAGVSVSVTCGPDSVASAAIPMPTTPGSYNGTAVGSVSGFTTSFVVTVVAPTVPPGGLPATGSGGIDTTTGIAAGLFAVGLGLFGVAQFRRRQAAVA